MLPKQHKLSTSAEFSRVVKSGKRKGSKTVVVHVWEHTAEAGIARMGGPRFGLIVSKSVGNAVVRHRVSRRLRHICAKSLGNMPDSFDVVIRALPASAQAPSEEMMRDVQRALKRLNVIP
ncbi:ribonuclease P protein component [Corynebacterium freiburgense]|uniref:ribonuclease P protein component n=1 Tax=Corynebacterium freiburgense TaxID=556548 RepID=UPI0004146B62|nr:ribonuclease P protein component [Corynebacterium freiburgense]WJZ03984.1 Ribonuclease P protein component [Corynebacterium freiburgense]